MFSAVGGALPGGVAQFMRWGQRRLQTLGLI